MVILVFAEIGATERDLEGEAVYDIQLLPESDLHGGNMYSGCAFTVFLDFEGAVLELEDCAVVLHEHGENLFFLRSVLRSAAI